MAKIVTIKIDSFIKTLYYFFLVSGGMLLHTMTALTIKHYHGKVWGVLSFALPGLAEFYLAAVQCSDRMFNFIPVFGLAGAVLLSATLLLGARKLFFAKLSIAVAK